MFGDHQSLVIDERADGDLVAGPIDNLNGATARDFFHIAKGGHNGFAVGAQGRGEAGGGRGIQRAEGEEQDEKFFHNKF